MPSQVALWVCLAGIAWLLARDVRRRPGLSGGLWLVVLWVIMIGSRSVSTWFSFGGEAMDAEAYDSGNPIERVTYFLFIALGGFLLYRRQLRLGEVVRANRWLFAFYVFWMLSALWADSPLIAFKRCFKDAGNVIMALIVLTEIRPIDAVKAVFVRCAYVLVPLSVVFILYIPELGRTYHSWSGDMMYTGVATHKNTLGVLALVSGVVLFWEIVDRWKGTHHQRWQAIMPDAAVFMMDVWLLFTSHSATSRFCFVVGIGLFLVLRMELVRQRMHLFVRVCVLGAALFAVLDTVFDLRQTATEYVLRLLNRDPTFTGRTDAWVVLVKELDNPLLGAGFSSFWTGARMEKIWEDYAIIQAHNGYVETYLNGGIVGLGMLAGLLLSTGWRIKSALYKGRPFSEVRFIFWLLSIIHNFSEASFCKLGLLWFVVLLVITEVPSRLRGIPRMSRKHRASNRRDLGSATRRTSHVEVIVT